KINNTPFSVFLGIDIIRFSTTSATIIKPVVNGRQAHLLALNVINAPFSIGFNIEVATIHVTDLIKIREEFAGGGADSLLPLFMEFPTSCRQILNLLVYRW